MPLPPSLNPLQFATMGVGDFWNAMSAPAPSLTVAPAAEGGVLSTVKVALGPAAGAVLPAVSVAVPAAMDIPRVPSPVRLETVTVRVVPVPDIPIDAVA